MHANPLPLEALPKAIMDTSYPIPERKVSRVTKPVSELTKAICDNVEKFTAIGESFVVNHPDYCLVGRLAGKTAKRLGFGIRAAPDPKQVTAGIPITQTRVWATVPAPPRAKREKKVVEAVA